MTSWEVTDATGAVKLDVRDLAGHLGTTCRGGDFTLVGCAVDDCGCLFCWFLAVDLAG